MNQMVAVLLVYGRVSTPIVLEFAFQKFCLLVIMCRRLNMLLQVLNESLEKWECFQDMAASHLFPPKLFSREHRTASRFQKDGSIDRLVEP